MPQAMASAATSPTGSAHCEGKAATSMDEKKLELGQPHQQRLATDGPQVLARDALGPDAGGHDAEDPHPVVISCTTAATALEGSTSGRRGAAVGGPPHAARA